MTDEASATAMQAYDRANDAWNLAVKNEVRMSTHEQQCADRYQGILDRLGAMQSWIVGAAAALILLLLGAAGSLFVLWQSAL